MIKRRWLGALVGLLALAGLVAAWSMVVTRAVASSQQVPWRGPGSTEPEPPYREIQGDVVSPTISFIDSPTATCYRPVAGTGACYIQWQRLQVSATSPQYIISMTLMIDGHMRAYHSGFFQTYIDIPGDVYGQGFKVTCGMPGSGGVPGLGKSYSYIIRAAETGGLKAANYGSVYCPADVVHVLLPLTKK